MPVSQFTHVQRRNWAPVQLVGEAMPDWMSGIPDSLVHAIYASGGPFPGLPYSDPQIRGARLVGGVDVYRHALDDPVEFNKDWYAVLSLNDGDEMLLIRGPIRDVDHWLNDLPDRLHNVEILAVPPRLSAQDDT